MDWAGAGRILQPSFKIMVKICQKKKREKSQFFLSRIVEILIILAHAAFDSSKLTMSVVVTI